MRDGGDRLNPASRGASGSSILGGRMQILVTGADGFIGRHVASTLEQAGHRAVRAVFGRAAGPGELRVDLTRPEQLARLPSEVEVVVHTAGQVDARIDRATMFAVNLDATRHLLAWARDRRVAHFIQLSSVAVYGPLALGEDRREDTPRLGQLLGLPYMRSKALAERAVEHSGVPYTLLRPPVVLGQGDTVISRGFQAALAGAGIPLLPGARPTRRVSLSLVDGLAEQVRLLVAHGPLYAPVHAIDFELTIGDLAERFAAVLGRPCRFVRHSWARAMQTRNEVGISWLVASTRFGQHYRRERLLTELQYRPNCSLESAIESGLSSLQGRSRGLF